MRRKWKKHGSESEGSAADVAQPGLMTPVHSTSDPKGSTSSLRKPREESENDAEVSSDARGAVVSTRPRRSRTRQRVSTENTLHTVPERRTLHDRALSRKSNNPPSASSSLRRSMLEMALFVVVWLAMMIRMWHSAPQVQHKLLELFAMGVLLLVCFNTHLTSSSTIWATRVRYLRKSEVSDILYAFLVPLLACAMLLDVVPSERVRPLAPPPMALGVRGAWRVERLPFVTDRLQGRGSLVDLHIFCAILMGVHVLASTIMRRRRKRDGARLRIEELSPVQAFTYYHGFGLALALICTGAHIVARLCGWGAWFFADTPSWAIVAIALNFQTQMYVWTRVAQQNCTLGELAIVCTLSTAMFHEATIVTIARLVPSYGRILFREPSTMLMYHLALMIGMLVIGAVLSPLLILSRNLARRPTHRLRWPDKRNLHRRLLSLAFFVLTLTIILGVYGPWVAWQLGGRNPWLYVVRSMLQGPYWWSRFALLGYWGLLCNIALLSIQLMVNRVWQYATVGDQVKPQTTLRRVPSVSSSGVLAATERASTLAATQFAEKHAPDESTSLGPRVAVSVNGRRKFFHALAVLLFVPGIAYDPAFMHLAFSVAFSLFILCEYMRFCAVFPFGATLHFFLSQFLDNKDTGLMIMSHVYLLSGCAAGIWGESQSRLVQQLGVLVLGIGDSCASIIGRQYGRFHWPRSKKTVEGTVGFVASTVACAYLLRMCHLIEPFRVAPFTVVMTLLAMLEGLSEQNDNLVLPIAGLVLSSMIPYS